MWDDIRQDITFASRTFVRNPGFAAVAILSLALGIGANTAIFSIITGVLLAPLEFGEPSELAVVWETSPAEGVERSEASVGIFLDWRERNQTFDDMTAWMWDSFILEGSNDTVMLNGVVVYPNFFSVLRTRPLLGRPFAMEDAPPGNRGGVILVSHRLWRDRWGADPAIVGKAVRIDGQPVTIIGVMRPDVAAPDMGSDIWIPAALESPIRWERHNRRLNVYGRLSPAVTIEQAQNDMSRIASILEAGEYSDIYSGWDARVIPLQEQVVGNVRPTLIVAFVSVGVVLLIACVNISNMLLARATTREREIAVRSALGAGRERIARQLLTESVVLAIGGGGLGIIFAKLTHRLILSTQPGILPRIEELSIDSTALGFALGLSVATGLVFGLVPALHGNRAGVQDSLKQGGSRGATAGRAHNRMRAILVAAQLALATVLLCAAGLLARSMLELRRVDPGFDPNRVLAARFFLDADRYDSGKKRSQYFELLSDRLEALPGVDKVGATSALPMDPVGVNYDLPYRLEDQQDLPDNELPQADFRAVTPGYFETLGVPLVSGRLFNRYDREDTPFVALVNQTMARSVWADQDPVGKRFQTPSTDWQWFEVVGVVGDTRYYGLASEPKAEMYVPHQQVPRSYMNFVLRTQGDPTALAAQVRNEIFKQDSGQPSHSIVSLESLIADSIAAQRFYALVLGIFAAIAVVLAGAGIYGVLSYWVNQRTHEIGVRMALGATRQTVLTSVVGHGMAMTMVGIAIGLMGSWATGRVLTSTLFGIGAGDPLTLVAVAFILILIALSACGAPAWRASRVDPLIALREE